MMLRRKKRRKWLIALGVVALIAGGVDYFWIDLFGGFWPITNLHRYRSVLAWIRSHNADYPPDVDVLEYFPKSVPVGASNPRLFFWTPPGDLDLEFRCTLPAAEVTAMIARVAPVAKATAHGSNEMSTAMESVTQMSFPILCVGDAPGGWSLPEKYTIYLTDVGHSTPDPSGTMSDYASGIAVDRASNDVIYWMEAASGSGNLPAGPAASKP